MNPGQVWTAMLKHIRCTLIMYHTQGNWPGFCTGLPILEKTFFQPVCSKKYFHLFRAKQKKMMQNCWKRVLIKYLVCKPPKACQNTQHLNWLFCYHCSKLLSIVNIHIFSDMIDFIVQCFSSATNLFWVVCKQLKLGSFVSLLSLIKRSHQIALSCCSMYVTSFSSI